MFDSIGWYSHLLLLFFLAVLFFVLVIALSRRWNTPPSKLRTLLTRSNGALPASTTVRLVPLLLLEERRRCFTDILGIVLSRYPLRRFTRRDSFDEAMTFLAHAVYTDPESPALDSAMCEVVKCFLEDPDVEYSCRSEFGGLVDEFLLEVERNRKETSLSAAPGNSDWKGGRHLPADSPEKDQHNPIQASEK